MKSFNYFIQQVWMLLKLPFRLLNSAINGLDEATEAIDILVADFNKDVKTYAANNQARRDKLKADLDAEKAKQTYETEANDERAYRQNQTQSRIDARNKEHEVFNKDHYQ